MIVYTDSKEFAQEYMDDQIKWLSHDKDHKSLPISEFISGSYFIGEVNVSWWDYLIAIKDAHRSQYDLLIELAKKNEKLANKTLLIAGKGKDFHGFKNRKWETKLGNLHLSVFLSPKKEIPNFGAAVMALPTVSIIQTLNEIDGINERPMIKWVNDIIVGRSKLAGVLAHSQAQGKVLQNIIFGIGMNIEKTPDVDPTPSVPSAISMFDMLSNKEKELKKTVFQKLIDKMKDNYLLLYHHQQQNIIKEYKANSIIINKKVMVYDGDKEKETEICRGTIERIGDNLELFFYGIDKPITKGRLVLL